MLLELSIKNYLSFKEKVTLSFTSTTKDNNNFDNNVNANNILKTTAIYWLNASGKTNLLNAVALIKTLVIDSRKIWPNELIILPWIRFQPFLLNTTSIHQPAEFEIIFEIEWQVYKYNFSLTNRQIVSENLYLKCSPREKLLFKRTNQNITIYNFDDNNSKKRVNETNLALSVFAKEWSEEAKKINKFFHDIYIFFKWYSFFDTENMLKSEPDTFKLFLINLVKNSDDWIWNINYYTKKVPFKSIPNYIDIERIIWEQKIQIPNEVEQWIREILHNVYDDEWIFAWYINLWLDAESDWTKKILWLAWSIYDVIRRWKILFIDELNEALHPQLLNNLIMSMHNANTTKPYQFIFTLHNTHTMNIQRIFKRDQIRFMKKWLKWNSKLTRLSDMNVRKDFVVEKKYFENKLWKDLEEKKNLLDN